MAILKPSLEEKKLAVLEMFFKSTGDWGEGVWARGQKRFSIPKRIRYLANMARWLAGVHGENHKYVEAPVDIQTFVEDKRFLNRAEDIYPAVMEALIELNSGRYVEAVLTGAIGTAKTTIAVITTAYQLYVLSCMKNPHAEFDLMPTDEITFVFQSVTGTLAKEVDFQRFKSLLDQSQYFQKEFSYDRSRTSIMLFPRRLVVKPLSGIATASLGQNVIGGVIDELNFMAMVEKSKMLPDSGTYDQAIENYNSIVRRRQSRFMKQGKLPGMLCLVSSSRYPGQFTDKKKQEARQQIQDYGRSDIFVYDKRVWEIKPAGTFCGEKFHVFTGTSTKKPRIIDDNEEVTESERELIMEVPVEYKQSFVTDILASLRDIGGVSTQAMHPFILDIDKLTLAFGKAQSIFSREDVDFEETNLEIYPKRIVSPSEPRFVHIDLGVTGDSAGVAIGWVPQFVKIRRSMSEMEIMPLIRFDGTLEVKPPPGGEIKFEKIRTILYKLRELGMNIRWVSMDTYQSTDSLQILASKGFMVGVQSLDTLTLPYDVAKQAFYDERVETPQHDKFRVEWVRLERDVKKDSIDHPPHGSKDGSDAMAGVIYGLTFRREIWFRHNVPPTQIPVWLNKSSNRERTSITGKEQASGKEIV